LLSLAKKPLELSSAPGIDHEFDLSHRICSA
jgi:hypothetical protein